MSTNSRSTSGLHHVTAISGPAQENLDFYVGVLGMRLVKRSVNQDDPGTYHLFYADAEGRAGTDLTFFPWAHLAPARPGHGLSEEVSLAVPPESLDFWWQRLERYGARVGKLETRFGESTLPVVDPHGLKLALVASPSAMKRPFTPWDESAVLQERQIRGLHTARLVERDVLPTEKFLVESMGFRGVGTEDGWLRFAVGEGGSGQFIDLREAPEARRGAWGTGSIHHLAWRVADDEQHLALRSQIDDAGLHPTPVIDRFWFRSVYFREPGGVVFELATDGPGFTVDEAAEHLGESLVLPPWLEASRPEIEAGLPKLVMPSGT